MEQEERCLQMSLHRFPLFFSTIDTDWVNEEIKQHVWFHMEERETQGPDVFTLVCTAHVCYLVVVGAHCS